MKITNYQVRSIFFQRITKMHAKALLALIFLAFTGIVQAQNFIHPGGWHTVADIQRIRDKIAANAEPWTNAKNAVMALSPSTTYQPNPLPLVKRDKVDNTGRTAFENDVYNSYILIVKWIITNDIAYANAAIRVIDGWSATLTELSGSDIKLLVGPVGGKFAQVAELAAYARPDWEFKTRAQEMFKTLFYPVVHPGASANWGTACMEGIMSFAIFCDNREMFDEAVYAYKYGFPVSDGCAAVTDYIDEIGEDGESGRDQAHPQGGMMHLLSVAVSAYNQGVNLFEYGDNRLKMGFEYLAKYNLGYSVPYHPFNTRCAVNWYPNGISNAMRAVFSKIWEMGFNYFRITGQSAPYSQMVAMQTAPEKSEIEAPGFGTLIFRRDNLWGNVAQTINFPDITVKSLGNADFSPGATSSSGLPVVYSSSNPTVATITDDGKIHLEGGGTSTIFAYQLGDSTYSAVYTSKVLTVNLDGYRRIEAENYNSQSGVQTEPTQDVDGVSNLSFVDPTDWTAYYNVDFGTKGATKFFVRYAILNTATSIEIRLGSATGTLLGMCNLPVTGAYQNWATDSCKITGAKGVQNVYLVYGGRVNVNWFRFDSTAINGQNQTITFPAIPSQTTASADFDAGATASSGLAATYTSSNTSVATIINNKVHITGIGTSVITATQMGDLKYNAATGVTQTLSVSAATVSAPYKANIVPGTIEAEDYDYGGEGLAYHDISTQNTNPYRNGDKVETESKAISSNGWNLSWVRGTEWLKYTLNVQDSGTYQVSLRYAFNLAKSITRTFIVQIDDLEPVEYTVNATGSWSTYNNYLFPLSLSSGTHVMKITLGGTSNDNTINLDAFTFKRTQFVTFNALPVKWIGDADFVPGATASSELPVVYTSSDTAVAVVANDKIHIKKAGASIITASQPGNSNYVASVPVSQTLTVLPLNLQVLYEDGDNGKVNNNSIRTYLQIKNNDSIALQYSELTARYWFTAENYAGINTWIDYAQLGNDKVKMKYVSLDAPRNGALGFVEYGFSSSAGFLVPGGNSGSIQSRFANKDWADFDESDDYSFVLNTSYMPNGNITLYRNGYLAWGTEPSTVSTNLNVKVYSENKNANTGTNTIHTYLKVSNEGNIPVSYKDLSVRYWFTSEGNSPLQYWIDYAKLGNSNVHGLFVTLDSVSNGADTYFEIAIDSVAGTLYPLSNTGNIQYRIAKTNWSNFDESDDYSYMTKASFVENGHITVYRKGKLIYGTEPGVQPMTKSVKIDNTQGDTQQNESIMFIAYPNPVVDMLKIRINSIDTEDVTITLHDNIGKLISSVRTNGAEHVLDLRNFPQGIYIITIANAHGSIVWKIVKE